MKIITANNSRRSEKGFSLVEFLLSAMIFILLSASVFTILAEVQQDANYQPEIQAVMDNARIALQTVEKYLRQAGNDPFGAGFQGITIINDHEVQVRSDIKGSQGASNPNKGDPDGDILDSDENVTLRFNPSTSSIEVVSGGTAQIICNHIQKLSFKYYDADGNITADGRRVRKITVAVSSIGDVPHMRTRQFFGLELQSEVRILT